jgi:hypothetical protein
MSMGKDRVRSVKWSNPHPSPPRAILTTARVGPYGYIPYHIYTAVRHQIYHPYTLDLGSYRITNSQKPQTHRIMGLPKTITRAGLIGLLSPATIWLTIGCLSHHPHRCSIHGSQDCHLPPSHRLIRPLIQRATFTFTTIGTSQYWQPPAHHLLSNCVCEFTIMPSSKW